MVLIRSTCWCIPSVHSTSGATKKSPSASTNSILAEAIAKCTTCVSQTKNTCGDFVPSFPQSIIRHLRRLGEGTVDFLMHHSTCQHTDPPSSRHRFACVRKRHVRCPDVSPESVTWARCKAKDAMDFRGFLWWRTHLWTKLWLERAAEWRPRSREDIRSAYHVQDLCENVNGTKKRDLRPGRFTQRRRFRRLINSRVKLPSTLLTEAKKKIETHFPRAALCWKAALKAPRARSAQMTETNRTRWRRQPEAQREGSARRQWWWEDWKQNSTGANVMDIVDVHNHSGTQCNGQAKQLQRFVRKCGNHGGSSIPSQQNQNLVEHIRKQQIVGTCSRKCTEKGNQKEFRCS